MQINSSETWWTWPRIFGSLGLSVCNLVVFFSSMPKTVHSMNPHRKISGTWVTSYYYLHHSSSNWIIIPGNSANSFWTNLSSVSPFSSANVASTNNPIRLIFLKHTLIGSTLWFKSFNYSPSKNNLQIPLSGLRPPGSGSYLFFFFFFRVMTHDVFLHYPTFKVSITHSVCSTQGCFFNLLYPYDCPYSISLTRYLWSIL